MVYHINAFEHIGRPGGDAADLYKHWRDEGVRLAKQRQRNESIAWFCFVMTFFATITPAAKDYAFLGVVIGGALLYRAIICRIEESTAESLLHKWDLESAIEMRLGERKEERESRMHELTRPATAEELARRSEIVGRLDSVLAPNASGRGTST